jgi:hypothetical protein
MQCHLGWLPAIRQAIDLDMHACVAPRLIF